MHHLTKQFIKYCEDTLSFKETSEAHYQSLPVCILDCVYSLRAPYYSVTVPLVDRYATRYMNGDCFATGDTLTAFLQRVDAAGGPWAFADRVLNNHQKLGGKANIPKEEVCYQLARYLKLLHIDTLSDFQHYECPELLETVIRSVKGIGDAGVNYLFMLTGDPNRCKPDVHIRQYIRDFCGQELRDEEYQQLFSDAVELLRDKYPTLTVQALDGIIWHKYQRKS